MKINQKNPSNELRKLRKIIGDILELLENNVVKTQNANIKISKRLKSLIGEKESIVSTIYKLGNLLIKIDSISMEENENGTDKIDQLDIEIIREFLSKKCD